MIGYIEGKIIKNDSIRGSVILLTSSGVGYEVNYSNQSIKEGDNLSLYIHTNVSENDIRLWGFNSVDELDMFNLLIGVSGVGPTSASNMLQNLGIIKIVSSIKASDAKGIKSPGVGIKTAQKIIIDLSEKIEKYPNLNEYHSLDDGDKSVNNLKEMNDNIEEAIMALVSLGYNKADVMNYFKKNKDMEGDTSALVKTYLSSSKK